MEEAAVGWEEADWLGVEDWVGFLVHASADEEDCQARVEEAVVDRVCTTLSVCRAWCSESRYLTKVNRLWAEEHELVDSVA